MAARQGVSRSGHRGSQVRETVLVALIGAGIVALWFLALDIFHGRPLFTPGALGSAVLLQARGVAEVEVSAVTVLGYTVIHLLAFLALGWVAVRLFHARDEEPRAVLGIVLLFVVLEVFTIGLIAIAASWLLDALSFWGVVSATLLAAVGMGLFLWRQHPAVEGELRMELEERQ